MPLLCRSPIFVRLPPVRIVQMKKGPAPLSHREYASSYATAAFDWTPICLEPVMDLYFEP